MNKSLNIAHRGFSGAYPENTMLAFKKAIDAGCDGIETDVHMTKDGTMVLCHDEKLDRTTNSQGFIKDYTFHELCKVDAGIKFDEKFKNETIPTIDEFLSYVKDKNLVINLELKNNIVHYEGLEEQIIKKIYHYNMRENIILSSFDHNSMVKIKEIDNTIKTGLLYGATLYKAQDYAKIANADALHPFFPAVMDKEIVENIKKAGLLINAYTVNDKNDMQSLINLGIDGIITNYPDKLKVLLENLH